jgi:excisionase family DNA binding protein
MAAPARRPIETVQRYSLTRKEAAAALGVSVDTFERRIQPFIRVVVCGQLILVPPAELERWVKANARFLV